MSTRRFVRTRGHHSIGPRTLIVYSKASLPIITKFHIEPPGAGGMKMCANHSGHMTDMAICGKNLKNPILLSHLNIGCET